MKIEIDTLAIKLGKDVIKHSLGRADTLSGAVKDFIEANFTKGYGKMNLEYKTAPVDSDLISGEEVSVHLVITTPSSSCSFKLTSADDTVYTMEDFMVLFGKNKSAANNMLNSAFMYKGKLRDDLISVRTTLTEYLDAHGINNKMGVHTKYDDNGKIIALFAINPFHMLAGERAIIAGLDPEKETYPYYAVDTQTYLNEEYSDNIKQLVSEYNMGLLNDHLGIK